MSPCRDLGRHGVAPLALASRPSLPVAPLGVSGGGDEQIRTVDPLLARQVLSQLSYTPPSFRAPQLLFRCSTS